MADDIVFEYDTNARTGKELRAEAGWVAGTFADAVDDGWEIDALDATIFDPDGLLLGGYRIDAAWARQYARGDLPAEAYSSRVIGTLEMLG